MSREELLITLDKSKCNLKKLSKNGLEQIAKMKNISQNELEQIIKMLNILQNELEQIAKMRRIKDYKSMSNEGLLSLAELYIKVNLIMQNQKRLKNFLMNKEVSFQDQK